MDKVKYYSDINLNFKPHPLTGDVTLFQNDAAVKRSLVHIGMMLPYDIPFEPNKHGHIRELLFELPSDTVKNTLETRIKWALNQLEPRANIRKVNCTISHDESAWECEVIFDVLSIMGEQRVQFFIERIR